MQIIECIPNFSAGKDFVAIDQIIYSLKRHDLTVLHVDSGSDANRTVVTMIGTKSALLAGVFDMIATARDLIDLRNHTGIHPYIGAVDVVPFVPLKNATIDDCIQLSKELGERVYKDLQIPVFLYANSASTPARASLSFLRRGNFPNLANRMSTEQEMCPDFGQAQPHPTAGAVAIGARPLMVAFNISLNTSSVKAANRIASLIRENTSLNTKPTSKYITPLRLPSVKAIGWFVSEFNCAQVSTNIMNFGATPVHVVFEAVKDLAAKDGITVIGSQLVGLIPEQALLAAGQFYAKGMPATKDQLMQLGIKHLKLDKHQEFILEERVLEQLLKSL